LEDGGIFDGLYNLIRINGSTIENISHSQNIERIFDLVDTNVLFYLCNFRDIHTSVFRTRASQTNLTWNNFTDIGTKIPFYEEPVHDPELSDIENLR